MKLSREAQLDQELVGHHKAEHVLNAEENRVKAQTVLEINLHHAIADRLKALYTEDKEKLAEYTRILYAQARLIGGMSIENPTELSNMVCGLML